MNTNLYASPSNVQPFADLPETSKRKKTAAPPVVAAPDLAVWESWTKALADRPASETIQPNRLPAFVREVLNAEKVEQLKSILATHAKLDEEMAEMSPLKIQDECERQRAAFHADPKSAKQPEDRAVIELRWRLRRQALVRQWFAENGEAYAAALKPLVQAAINLVRKRIREYMSAEDAAAESLGCPPPSPSWLARNLLKLENALSNDLASIEDFIAEFLRFKNGGTDAAGLQLPGGYLKNLLASV